MSERRKKLSIFDLVREYLDDMEALAEELKEHSFMERPSWDTRSCCLEPLCRVFVTPDEVIVTADLPNVKPGTIKVKPISAEALEISAEMRRKIRFNELGISHREGEFRFFRRQTSIPVPTNMNRATKEFKRGILEVHLPRKKGYRIKVE